MKFSSPMPAMDDQVPANNGHVRAIDGGKQFLADICCPAGTAVSLEIFSPKACILLYIEAIYFILKG